MRQASGLGGVLVMKCAKRAHLGLDARVASDLAGWTEGWVLMLRLLDGGGKLSSY
jgi:hypothetical protein